MPGGRSGRVARAFVEGVFRVLAAVRRCRGLAGVSCSVTVPGTAVERGGQDGHGHRRQRPDRRADPPCRFGVCVRWSRQLVCEQPDLPVLGVRTPLGAIDSRFVLASRGRCADAAVGPSRHEPYVACLTRGVCPGAGIVWRPAMRRRGRRSAVRRRSPWRAFAFGAMLASWLRRVPAMSAVPDVYEHAARVRVNLAAGWQA